MTELLKSDRPCVPGSVAAWHAQHGFLWNVLSDGREIGCFYISYAGTACFLHAEKIPGVPVPPAAFLHAFRDVMGRLGKFSCVYATVRRSNARLIGFLVDFGFDLTDAGYADCADDGEAVDVLIYRMR